MGCSSSSKPPAQEQNGQVPRDSLLPRIAGSLRTENGDDKRPERAALPMGQDSSPYFDVFLSHRQSEAQDAVISIKQFLEAKVPWIRIWLDLEQDPTEAGMEDGVKNSSTFLLYITATVMKAKYCRQELLWAIKYGVPVLLVFETDARHNAPDLNAVRDSAPEEARYIFKEQVAIAWYRDPEHRAVALTRILKGLKLEHRETNDMWRAAFGTAQEAPWSAFAEKLLAHLQLEPCRRPSKGSNETGTLSQNSGLNLASMRLALDELKPALAVDDMVSHARVLQAMQGDESTGFQSSSWKDMLLQVDRCRAESKRVWKIVIRDSATKQVIPVDAGFVMLKESDALSDARSEVVVNSQEDDELEEDLCFLSKEPGLFSFFLDNGKTRVRRKQEKSICGQQLDTACIVRDLPRSVPKGSTTNTDIDNFSAEAVAYYNQMDDERVPAQSASTSRMLEKKGKEAWAHNISVNSILEDPVLFHSFKKTLGKLKIGEENALFLQALHTLKSKIDEEDPVAATGGIKALMTEYFSKGSPMELLLTNEDVESAQNAAALDDLATPAQKVEASLAKPIEALRKNLARAPRTKGKPGLPNVVVIGGGFGGTAVAKWLDKMLIGKAHVTLIDQKEYFEYTPGVLRSMVREDFWDSIKVLHSKYIRNGSVVIGRAVAINEDHVLVGAEKQIVPYDYLAVFVGSSYTSDIKTTNSTTRHRQKQMDFERRKIELADRILVVGGGVVGCELAGDIRHEFPDKKVQMVQGNNQFMPRIAGAHKHLQKWFDEHNVDYILNERIVKFDPDQDAYLGDKGTKIPASGTKVFWATGYTANTDWLRASDVFKGALDPKGFVECEPTLQVPGHPNVFAGGDILAASFFARGERMAAFAIHHAMTVTHNIIQLVTEPVPRLYNWSCPGGMPCLVLELGWTDAVGVFPNQMVPMFEGMMGKEATAGLLGSLDKSDDGYVGLCPLSSMKVDYITSFIKDLVENEDTSWNTYNGMAEFLDVWDRGPEAEIENEARGANQATPSGTITAGAFAADSSTPFVQVELTNNTGRKKRLKLAADATVGQLLEEYRPSGMAKQTVLVMVDTITELELGKDLQLGCLEAKPDNLANGDMLIRLTLKEDLW